MANVNDSCDEAHEKDGQFRQATANLAEAWGMADVHVDKEIAAIAEASNSSIQNKGRDYEESRIDQGFRLFCSFGLEENVTNAVNSGKFGGKICMRNVVLFSVIVLLAVASAELAAAQTSAGGMMKVKVLFPKDDPNAEIQLVAVEREVKKTKSVADAALRELFKGIGDKEKAMGLVSTFEAKDIVAGRDECQGDKMKGLGAYFIGVSIRKGVAIVNFKPEGECYLQTTITAGEYVMKPIEATLKQFKTIKKVEYAINGKVITEWDA